MTSPNIAPMVRELRELRRSVDALSDKLTDFQERLNDLEERQTEAERVAKGKETPKPKGDFD